VIIAIVTPIANAIGWVVQLLNKFLESQGVTQKMSEAFQKMVTFVSGVINWLKDRIIEGVNNFKANLLAIGSVVMTVIGFFQKIKDGVTEKVSALISFVSGIPGRIMSAVGNLGSLLYNAGRDILQGLLNGISDMIGKLKSKLGEVTNLIPDWKGPMDTDRKLLTPWARNHAGAQPRYRHAASGPQGATERDYGIHPNDDRCSYRACWCWWWHDVQR